MLARRSMSCESLERVQWQMFTEAKRLGACKSMAGMDSSQQWNNKEKTQETGVKLMLMRFSIFLCCCTRNTLVAPKTVRLRAESVDGNLWSSFVSNINKEANGPLCSMTKTGNQNRKFRPRNGQLRSKRTRHRRTMEICFEELLPKPEKKGKLLTNIYGFLWLVVRDMLRMKYFVILWCCCTFPCLIIAVNHKFHEWQLQGRKIGSRNSSRRTLSMTWHMRSLHDLIKGLSRDSGNER